MYKRALVCSAVLLTAAGAQSPDVLYDLTSVYDTHDSWLNLRHRAEESSTMDDRQIVSSKGRGGMLWNTHALPCGTYELTVELTIQGQGANLQVESRFEGLGIWFVDNTTTADITDHYQSGVNRKLLEYRTDYVGFGTFLAVENRQKGIKPSVSVLFNDGTPLLMDDVPTEFGLYWNFLKESHLSLRFTVDGGQVTTKVKPGDQDEWRKVSTVTGPMDVCGHFGISASNKRAGGQYGAEVSLKSVELTTLDYSYFQAFVPEAVVEEESLPLTGDEVPLADTLEAALPVGLELDIVQPRGVSQVDTRALEAMVQQLGAQQNNLSRELQSLKQLMTSENARTQNVRDRHQREQVTRQQQLERAMQEVKELLLRHGDTGASGLAESHKSIEHLQANAASLESTVRRATTYSTYFAGGLSLSFLIFGGLIYKRMKDMEKKHFL